MVKVKGDSLTRMRVRAGFTASALARKIGATGCVITKAESGNGVYPHTAKAICDALGADFDDLFEIVRAGKGVEA